MPAHPSLRPAGLAAFAVVMVLTAGTGRLAAEGADRPPGRPASGICAQVSLRVAHDGLRYDNGTVGVGGSWQLTGTAAQGVLLEYKIDSDRYQAQRQLGGAGKWTFSDQFKECGSHLFEANAFPEVVENGRTVYCLAQGVTAKAVLEIPCLGPSSKLECGCWFCRDESCTGTCTGDAGGGQWGYVAMFGINDANYQALPSSPHGPWSQTITCVPGERVSFKARDRLGAGGFSPVVERPCGR